MILNSCFFLGGRSSLRMCLLRLELLRILIRNFGVLHLRLRVMQTRMDFLLNRSSRMGYLIRKLDLLYRREYHPSHFPSTLTKEFLAFINRITQHHYSGTFCSGGGKLLQDLMTKETIRSNLTSFASDAKAVRDQGLDFVMGETNSYSCHVSAFFSVTISSFLISFYEI